MGEINGGVFMELKRGYPSPRISSEFLDCALPYLPNGSK